MQQWLKTSLLLCVFGFLKEIRPSESFTYELLTDPQGRNLSDSQVANEAYPIGIYTNLVVIIILFLITDIFRYKPIIILVNISGVISHAMLAWTTSLFHLQILEIFYGIFLSKELPYYTYIYAKVDKVHYSAVSSHSRAAYLSGRALSGVISQLVISTKLLEYQDLTYISFSTVTASTIWACFLPSVKKSIYFNSESIRNLSFLKRAQLAFRRMFEHAKKAFTNPLVVKWSIWWSLSTCGYVQIESFMQPLYSTIQNNFESKETSYNGAVEATLTLLGFLAALFVGYVRVDWQHYGDVALIATSLVHCAILIVIAQTEYIVLCYVLYVVFGIFYQFMVTVASAQISQWIEEDSYALIFGINTFISLCFNAILTAAVATEGIGFALELRGQYLVYGGFFGVIALIHIVIGIEKVCKSYKSQKT